VLDDIGLDVALESGAAGFRSGGELKVTDGMNAKRSSGTHSPAQPFSGLNATGDRGASSVEGPKSGHIRKLL
jgi:hypothetical protein